MRCKYCGHLLKKIADNKWGHMSTTWTTKSPLGLLCTECGCKKPVPKL